jgi:rhodanese-related sulfurtransferase
MRSSPISAPGNPRQTICSRPEFGEPVEANPAPYPSTKGVKVGANELDSEGVTSRRFGVFLTGFQSDICTTVMPLRGATNALSTESVRGSDDVSVRELADMRSAGREHTVLDVREARELDICRLEGALHIPMAEIPARTDVLPTNQPLVVICHHGARSQMVVDFLRNAGFDNAINLNGGIEAWACEIDQSMRRYR